MDFTAKKRFGQNFLIDSSKADELVDSLNIKKGETVIEIGPGKGTLTERILSRGARLIAVELDRELAPFLNNKFGQNGNFSLIESDIIRVDPREITDHPVKIIGNLPYNISGAIIEWLISYYKYTNLAVITVQAEVADRLKANINCRDYGALTILIQSYYDLTKLFDIPPGCFSPKPKVLSTALKLVPNLKISEDIEYHGFRKFIRACFSQKRKILINSLSASTIISKIEAEKLLVSMDKKTDIRAEQMTLQELVKLYRLVNEKNG